MEHIYFAGLTKTGGNKMIERHALLIENRQQQQFAGGKKAQQLTFWKKGKIIQKEIWSQMWPQVVIMDFNAI